ncbi:MAG: enoyl-CoA hydratase-related protein [Promethearchaeati archaeon SRVP18_Atabeyarchaeia-1]
MSSPQYKNIILEKKDGIARLTVNRPQVYNALNPETMNEIADAIANVGKDASVKVLVITGAGEKAFVAGADINTFPTLTPKQAKTFSRLGQVNITRALELLPKPVIAAVNGLAYGGGCEIVLACDFIIASENAKFCQPEINLAILPGWGGTQRLPRIVGTHKAKELCIIGEPIDAKEAERIGLVYKVVPVGKLNEAVDALISKLASKSPVAIQLAKDAVNKALDEDLDTGLNYEAELFAKAFTTEDHVEGAKAYLEKRRAVFKGK